MNRCELEFPITRSDGIGAVRVNGELALRFNIWGDGVALAYLTTCCDFVPVLEQNGITCSSCSAFYALNFTTPVAARGRWAESIEEWLSTSGLNPLELTYAANAIANQTQAMVEAYEPRMAELEGKTSAQVKRGLAIFVGEFELAVLP